VGESRNHNSAPLFQRTITVAGDALGRPRQQSGKRVCGNTRARLKLGWHRSRAENGYPHAARFQFLIERLAERDYKSLAGIIDRHTGPRQEAGDRSDIENAALAAFQAVNEGERKSGQRAHVDVDHGELLRAVERVGPPEQTEPGVVDDDFRLETEARER